MLFKVGDRIRLSQHCLDEVYRDEYIYEFAEWALNNKGKVFTITEETGLSGYRINACAAHSERHTEGWVLIEHEMDLVKTPQIELPEDLFYVL